MSDGIGRLGCPSDECRWVMTGNGSPGCVDGGSTCVTASLLAAAPSDFHDQSLIALTQQINALLQAVPPDPAGRKLSFMLTRMGLLLGWVEHGMESDIPENAVTAASDNAAIVQALGLIQ